MKKKAFTLIELLVVIAIIAVLMGILMPSLRAARDQAKRLHCVSNIKTLTMGWVMYAGENDNKIVNGNVQVNKANNSWVLAPANANDPIELKLETIRQGALYNYVGKEVNVYRCPADIRIKDPSLECFRSFSIAGGANGEGDGGGWNYKTAKSLTEIKRPSEKYIFIEDIDPRGYNMGSWAMKFNPIGWVDPLAIWHNKKSTMGFADGHGEMHQWRDKSLIDWCQQAVECRFTGASFGFDMVYPPDQTEDVRYMAKGFPCKSHLGKIN